MHPLIRLAPLLLAASGALAQSPAPAPELPKDLHGHWTVAATSGKARPQTFDLENIQRKDEGTFAARLSWNTPDPKCTIRFQPLTGRITPTGLRFEATTPCNEPITAELARQGNTWIGQATGKASPAAMELTAK